MRPALVFCLLVFSFNTWGFFPEYEHFTDEESAEINSPRLISSEYESDRLTYQYLSSWNTDFLNNPSVFQYTAGSLGPSRFYTRGRSRMRQTLSDNWSFQLAYAELGDPRSHRQSLIFEFFYRLTPWLELSLYGDPSTLKKQDDIGLSSTFYFTETSQLRLYYTWVDFSHNKRNELADRYDNQPARLGLVWRQWQNNSFMQFSAAHDQATTQVFSGGRVYQFGATEAQWLSRHALDEVGLGFINSEVNYRRSHEGDTVNTDQGVQRWENTTVDGLIQGEWRQGLVHQVGLRALHSQWSSVAGNVIHNNLLPHMWLRPWSFRVGHAEHNIDAGYEMTWHRGQGPMALRSTLDRQDVLEHRMNWRYGIDVANKTRVNFLLTFDLDEFGTGETWEGGAMQFSTVF